MHRVLASGFMDSSLKIIALVISLFDLTSHSGWKLFLTDEYNLRGLSKVIMILPAKDYSLIITQMACPTPHSQFFDKIDTFLQWSTTPQT